MSMSLKYAWICSCGYAPLIMALYQLAAIAGVMPPYWLVLALWFDCI